LVQKEIIHSALLQEAGIFPRFYKATGFIDSRRLTPRQKFVHGSRGPAAFAHGKDDRGGAEDDIASGIYPFQGGFLLPVNENSSPAVGV
jgi:hypothetical protein